MRVCDLVLKHMKENGYTGVYYTDTFEVGPPAEAQYVTTRCGCSFEEIQTSVCFNIECCLGYVVDCTTCIKREDCQLSAVITDTHATYVCVSPENCWESEAK